MSQASLAALETLKKVLLNRGSKPATCVNVSNAITLILEIFEEAEEERKALAECIDDLALAQGYQLKEKSKGADHG